MRHFALTHSLTLAAVESIPAKMVLFLRKPGEAARPCHWLRLDGIDFADAIETGRAALSESLNIAVVVASADVTDRAIAASLAEALSSAGLQGCDLQPCRDGFALSGAA
jgi:hypothetical protein